MDSEIIGSEKPHISQSVSLSLETKSRLARRYGN